MKNILKFENNLAEINLDTLKSTASYEMARGGLRKSAPIEHHELIHNLCSKVLAITKFKPVLDTIYATEKNTLRVMWKGKKEECPVENHLVQRILTRIDIIEPDQKKLNVSIAVAYHETGIQIAYGTNVQVCKNLLIFGSNRVSTYGQDKVPFDKLMDVIDDWLRRYDEKKERDYDIIEVLQKRKVKDTELLTILGKLIYQAERNNTFHKNGAPLNVSQTLRLIDNYNIEITNKISKSITAFNLLQWGTNNLKPNQDGRDLTQTIDTSNKFSNFIVKELCPEINLN